MEDVDLTAEVKARNLSLVPPWLPRHGSSFKEVSRTVREGCVSRDREWIRPGVGVKSFPPLFIETPPFADEREFIAASMSRHTAVTFALRQAAASINQKISDSIKGDLLTPFTVFVRPFIANCIAGKAVFSKLEVDFMEARRAKISGALVGSAWTEAQRQVFR